MVRTYEAGVVSVVVLILSLNMCCHISSYILPKTATQSDEEDNDCRPEENVDDTDNESDDSSSEESREGM